MKQTTDRTGCKGKNKGRNTATRKGEIPSSSKKKKTHENAGSVCLSVAKLVRYLSVSLITSTLPHLVQAEDVRVLRELQHVADLPQDAGPRSKKLVVFGRRRRDRQPLPADKHPDMSSWSSPKPRHQQHRVQGLLGGMKKITDERTL